MTSLYRRHRPQSFDEVVGQQHVVRTMRNAVEQGKVHHAYLFVGSRGTGKTSIAKILARSLNCKHGPTLHPCGECESCVAIAAATSLDVIEMDAASHNSVDDIRDLREKVGFAPALGRYKVYILDEAHMLSNAAWNAFLKTLEEPPPNTIFVLATTEPHKVPPTIVDRCHRFDFHRPSLEEITTVLRRIADLEQIEAEDSALAMIARSAAGSFRDAIGTLDQLVTYGGKQVASEDVREVLDVADADLILRTTDAIVDHDAAAALTRAQELQGSGRDPSQFMRDLTAHLRHLVVIQALGEAPDSFAVTAHEAERLEAQAERLPQAEAVRAIDLVAAALREVKEGADPRIQLELALLKAARPRADLSIEALLTRIEQLERGGGSAPTDDDRPPARAAKAPPSKARERKSGDEPGEPRAPAERESGATASLEDLELLWPAVLDRLRGVEGGAMLAALLHEAHPVALEDGLLVIAYPHSAAFSKRKVESRANRDRVVEALRLVTSQPLAVDFRLGDEHIGERARPGDDSPLGEDEVIERFKRVFGAEDVLEPASGEAPDQSG